jgi:hypothetical protein
MPQFAKITRNSSSNVLKNVVFPENRGPDTKHRMLGNDPDPSAHTNLSATSFADLSNPFIPVPSSSANLFSVSISDSSDPLGSNCFHNLDNHFLFCTICSLAILPIILLLFQGSPSKSAGNVSPKLSKSSWFLTFCSRVASSTNTDAAVVATEFPSPKA